MIFEVFQPQCHRRTNEQLTVASPRSIAL